MGKKYLWIALLLGFVGSPFRTLAFSAADSVTVKKDSIPLLYPTDKYATFLMQSSPFVYDRILSPFQSDSFPIPAAGFYRFGMNAYQQYLNVPSPALPLDTHLAVSELRVVLGSKREQMIFLDHHQRISKRMTGFVSYNNLVSPGFLLNSLSRYRRLNLNLHFHSRFVFSTLDVGFLKIAVDENGGIKPNQKVEGRSKSDFEQLSTFLPDDKREIRRSFVDWNNEVTVYTSSTESDSGALFKVKLTGNGSYYKFGTAYTGTADSTYYPNEFLDSLVTSDTAGYDYYSIQPGLSLVFQQGATHAILKSSWTQYYLSNRIDSLTSSREYSVISTAAVLSSNVGQMEMKFDQVVSTFNTNADFSLLMNASYQTNLRFLSSIQVAGGVSELAPEATSSFYLSNHFRWSNALTKEKFTWIKPSINFFENALSLYAHIVQVDNYVYFNDRALPSQQNEKVEVVMTGLKMDVVMRHWRFLGHVRYMQSSKGYIRLPEVGTYARISYRDRYFKKALLAEFGVSVCMLSEWKGYAYMPATGAQYLQSDQLVGGSPSMDVFFNAGLGRATLTLMLQRINNKWFGGENFLAAGYPAPPNTLKFGLFWKLYN